MERDCEACNFRESNIGYPSPCPAHEKKETSTTPNEREDWEKELQEYGALHDEDCYELVEETCECDMGGMRPFIKSLLSRTRQEEREKGRQEGQERAVEFIRENGVISFEDAVLKRYIYSVSADLLEQARDLT